MRPRSASAHCRNPQTRAGGAQTAACARGSAVFPGAGAAPGWSRFPARGSMPPLRVGAASSLQAGTFTARTVALVRGGAAFPVRGTAAGSMAPGYHAST